MIIDLFLFTCSENVLKNTSRKTQKSIFGLAAVAIATTVDEGFDYDSLGLKKPNKGSDEPADADKVIHTRPTHSP